MPIPKTLIDAEIHLMSRKKDRGPEEKLDLRDKYALATETDIAFLFINAGIGAGGVMLGVCVAGGHNAAFDVFFRVCVVCEERGRKALAPRTPKRTDSRPNTKH